MKYLTVPSFALPIRMPRFHPSWPCMPPLPSRHGLRFGVGHVDHVVLVDEDAARPAELRPLVDELAVLIEDLDPVVVAIADEQPAARIDRERVRLIELARGPCRACPTP